MAEPTVSVLMPVGRMDEYVQPAVQSVLNQHDVELELILVGPQDANDAEGAFSEFAQTLEL